MIHAVTLFAGFPSHQMNVDNGSHSEYSNVMGDGQYQDKYQRLQEQHEIEKRVSGKCDQEIFSSAVV